MVLVLSLAKERKDFVKKCESYTDKLAEHFAKAIIDGEDGIHLEHHLKEIINWLTIIAKTRQKEWDTMKDSVLFFDRFLCSDYDILKQFDDAEDEIIQSNKFEDAVNITTELYKKYLIKRKVPDINWFKKKLKPVWKLLKD